MTGGAQEIRAPEHLTAAHAIMDAAEATGRDFTAVADRMLKASAEEIPDARSVLLC